ncbi:MAG: metal-dependent hydrolase [Candidatus Moranbacteria bacterium]|nr:metal-dependent hydrolase [Candidatus Moranbacteria bacterium]
MPELRFLGHAAFELRVGGKIILFDPWITGNPKSPLASLDEIEAADIILVTHDHYDHGFEDAVAIAKRTGATLVAIAELANEAKSAGLAKVVSGNLGGTVGVGGIRITFIPAYHSSGVGIPCGFVVRSSDFTAYHAGDTSFFGDMSLLADEKIDLALLPIGGTFTMDIRGAARAVEAIRPKTVIPMHYDTFPAIVADTGGFERLVGHHTKARILDTGEKLAFP